MKKSPLVSVIIPVYNNEEYLEKCIGSIVNQTYKNLEVIVVSDNSPGDTKAVLGLFNDKRLKSIYLDENVGSFRARVKGVSIAKGDYFTFIDGDDYVLEDYIEKLVTRAVEANSDITMGEFIFYDDNTHSKIIHNTLKTLPFNDTINTDLETFAQLIKKGNAFWEMCGKLYKKSVISKTMSHIKNIDRHIVMGEDILFNFHAVYFCKKFARAEFAFYIYRRNDSSITAKSTDFNKKKKVVEDLIFVLDKVKQFMEKQGIYSRFNSEYRFVRNQQAARHYLEVREYFNSNPELIDLVYRLANDKKGLMSEVSVQEYSLMDDIEELRKEVASMNSTKVSIKKALSNIQRKIKSAL